MSKAKPTKPIKASKSALAMEDTLAKLVQNLADAEAALLAHLGDQVDSITDHKGHPLLLSQAQKKLIENETMQRMAAQTQKGILDAIPAHIALLDANGVIVVVNESWREFATLNGLENPDFGIGSNYLEVCDKSAGGGLEEARAVSQGIRQVIQGEIPEFSLEYPCHSPTKQRWFRLVVTPVSSSEQWADVVVMHIDITERQLALNQLLQQEKEQRTQARQLNEAQAVAKLGSWKQICRPWRCLGRMRPITFLAPTPRRSNLLMKNFLPGCILMIEPA